MRVAAYRWSPSTVVYGLATVSRKVSPAAMMHTPSRNAQKALMWVAGINQKPPDRDHQQAGDDAALVAELRRQPARRQRHQEVTQIMRELHRGGLCQVQVQFLLEVLVHHVDHAVAEAPQGEQRGDEHEDAEEVAAFRA